MITLSASTASANNQYRLNGRLPGKPPAPSVHNNGLCSKNGAATNGTVRQVENELDSPPAGAKTGDAQPP